MRKWKNKNKKLPIVILSIISVVILVLLFRPYTPAQYSPEMISDLSTTGFVKVQPNAVVISDVGVVSLTGGCYQMTANTEASQAESIFNGINEIIGARPNTHDLIKDAFDNLKVDVMMVKITELRNNTFHGRLVLKNGNNIANLDSKPSDGIAIAVRVGAPIYIDEDLLKQQGKYIC